MVARFFHPLRVESLRPGRSALLLGGLLLASLAATQALVRGMPEPSVVLSSGVLVLLVTATHVLFPRSWFVVVLPILLITRPLWEPFPGTPWPLNVGMIVGPGLGILLLRYFSRHTVTLAAGEPPWVAGARMWTLASGTIAGLGLAVLLRSPKEPGMWLNVILPRAMAFAALAGMLVLGGFLVCRFIPKLRQSGALHLCFVCVMGFLPITIGYRAGQALAAEDLRISGERGAVLATEIEAYRQRRGELPASLQELVPRPFAVLPTAQAGFWPQSFEYKVFGHNGYALSYQSANGRAFLPTGPRLAPPPRAPEPSAAEPSPAR